MKIRAIIPDEQTHASSWWRILRPFTMMRQLGHDAKWLLHTDPIDDVDDSIVVIHRIIPANPSDYIHKLRDKGAVAVIYSTDDYTCDEEALREYLEASGGLTSYAINNIISRVPREIETMNLCDEVLVSSYGLFELVQEKTEKYVDVLENAIDEKWYLDALDEAPNYVGHSDTVYVGYASGRRPESDLVEMARAWQRICNDFPNVRFVLAGYQHDIIDRHIDLDRKIRIPFQPIETWPRSMQVDIGCCPLADTPFNRGKSSIKYLEYSLAGAAVVASPIVYDELVLNCVNGYIATTEDEWYERLAHLVMFETARRQFVDCANYEIHNYHTLDATINEWIAYFRGLMNENTSIACGVAE